MYVILNPVASRPTGVTVEKELQANETVKSDARIVVVSKKKLPDPGSHERFWGFVVCPLTTPKSSQAKASTDIRQLDDLLAEEHYVTKTRGSRRIPDARPLGAGVYSIVTYHNNAHLSYVLKVPQKVCSSIKSAQCLATPTILTFSLVRLSAGRCPGVLQLSCQPALFFVNAEGSFILSVRNPDTPSPPQAGLKGDLKASFPKHLKDIFHGRRFVSADPVEFLDHDGCEVLLIGTHRVQFLTLLGQF
ncbi:MAG: hypothetical protein BJ554DRAFT_5546 [Olpidium bornovanus]|uniref:Uncharacterized protein n=1 Tax=Olpidium bornovanus TaxID=278681 RepID=A0A8H8DKZ3_9FUNG|nr:MAG: hypothetical protein BJ554DRAFT_5546 [Olpidium bornovanus]